MAALPPQRCMSSDAPAGETARGLSPSLAGRRHFRYILASFRTTGGEGA
jgi:hypothetical protein